LSGTLLRWLLKGAGKIFHISTKRPEIYVFRAAMGGRSLAKFAPSLIAFQSCVSPASNQPLLQLSYDIYIKYEIYTQGCG